jgi:hypothetical protein
VTGSLTTADACYNSPDSLVLQILATKKDDFHTVLYNFIEFYVGGCPENVVPLPINDEVNKFLSYLDVVAAFVQDLQADQTFDDTCGSNKGILINGTSVVVEVICLVTITILDIRDLLNCDNWNSIYSVRNILRQCTRDWLKTFFLVVSPHLFVSLHFCAFCFGHEDCGIRCSLFQRNRRVYMDI